MRSLKKLFLKLYHNKSRLFKVCFGFMFGSFILTAFLFIYYSKDLPSSDTIGELFIPESTKILDRTETTVLYDIYGEQKRTIVAYEQIPQTVKDATVIAEDDAFYHHFGIDFYGIARAFWVNLRGGGKIKQGGSTITQQFVKNALLTPERTLARKIKEVILAIEVEWRYSKDEILGFYLNQVPYGANAYGIEAASQTYFKKHARELTLAQATALAALPQAPTYYSNNREALIARQQYILKRMFEFGYISENDYKNALNQEVVFEPVFAALKAPHFVIEVKSYLEEKYGSTFVQQAGLRVITTLDPVIQEVAEDVVSQQAALNQKNFNAHNAALVAIDPKTGQVLALVGSKDYFGKSSPEGCTPGKTCMFDPQVNIALSPQQPGSSFKPFAYAAAFQKGYTPETIIYDIPTEFNPDCGSGAKDQTDQYGQKCYHPDNYDLSYFGAIPFKEALAGSRNIPAVKVLYLAGIENTIELAKKMGVQSLQDASRYGLSLVLGGGDVELIEETSAFGVFATRGEYNPATFILKIEDKNGTVLEEFRKDSKQILEPFITDQINYVLSENSFRARVFGEKNHLVIPGLSTAAKTGTTEDFRDGWTVGYTKSLVTGVWVGNNNNKSMGARADGSAVAAPIWNTFLRRVYEEKQKQQSELKEKPYYFSLPTASSEGVFDKLEIPRTGKAVIDGIKLPHSILHYVRKEKPLEEEPENPSNDPQYNNWEQSVRRWVGGAPLFEKTNSSKTPKTTLFEIFFRNPQKNSFSSTETVPISVEIRSSRALKKIELLVDNKQIKEINFSEETTRYTTASSVLVKNLEQKNFHEIFVLVENERGDKHQESFIFTVD